MTIKHKSSPWMRFSLYPRRRISRGCEQTATVFGSELGTLPPHLSLPMSEWYRHLWPGFKIKGPNPSWWKTTSISRWWRSWNVVCTLYRLGIWSNAFPASPPGRPDSANGRGPVHPEHRIPGASDERDDTQLFHRPVLRQPLLRLQNGE